MIPESEDCSTRPTVGTSSSPFKSASSSAAASGSARVQALIRNPLLLQQQQQQPSSDNNSSSAWTRYRYFVEAMHSQGQAINRKLVLEAMFRGSDLVYSCSQSASPCPS